MPGPMTFPMLPEIQIFPSVIVSAHFQEPLPWVRFGCLSTQDARVEMNPDETNGKSVRSQPGTEP